MKNTIRGLLSLTILTTMLIMLAITGSAATVRWSDNSGEHSMTVTVDNLVQTFDIRIEDIPETEHSGLHTTTMEGGPFSVSLNASYDRSRCANNYLIQAIQASGLSTKYTETGHSDSFEVHYVSATSPAGNYAYFMSFLAHGGEWESYNGWLYTAVGAERIIINAFQPESGEILYAPYMTGTASILKVS